MTDLEWDDADDPAAMLRFLFDFEEERLLRRKVRLFAAAACRRVWHLLPYSPFRDALEGIENLAAGRGGERKSRELAADALAFWQRESDRRQWRWFRRPANGDVTFSPQQRLAAQGLCGIVGAGGTGPDVIGHLTHLTAAASQRLAETPDAPQAVLRDAEYLAERAAQADLLREIVGNPFWRCEADPRWLTSTVLDLARLIHREARFELLPILADALMDVGCDDDRLLLHCRGSGPHVRGCWVVDLVWRRSGA
jgi:hypothetical protein